MAPFSLLSGWFFFARLRRTWTIFIRIKTLSLFLTSFCSICCMSPFEAIPEMIIAWGPLQSCCSLARHPETEWGHFLVLRKPNLALFGIGQKTKTPPVKFIFSSFFMTWPNIYIANILSLPIV